MALNFFDKLSQNFIELLNDKDSYNVIIKVENKEKSFMAWHIRTVSAQILASFLNKIKPYEKIIDKQLWEDINQHLLAPERPVKSIILPPRPVFVADLPPCTNKPEEFFSTIVSKDHVAEISTIAYTSINKSKLILSGTRDGFASQNFGIFAMVTLVQLWSQKSKELTKLCWSRIKIIFRDSGSSYERLIRTSFPEYFSIANYEVFEVRKF
ncbi:hypothetical protein Glove_151g77 [Diversispora epigaea]|uniref:Uncharacterized protein n=1 Tax=Diversispora epigaea TaxID=1348612 RepID=A0A397IT84_9GLOM|nr:hypothetical protein Glove_151g77 [Diversispora epigaea]